jgi:hypothetical protein
VPVEAIKSSAAAKGYSIACSKVQLVFFIRPLVHPANISD